MRFRGPIVNLLTPDGRINRAAVLLDARRQYRLMSRHGWDWSESLRYCWLRARAMQHTRENARMENDIYSTRRWSDDEVEAGA